MCRWVLARLRHQRFFSLEELNAAIRPLLKQFFWVFLLDCLLLGYCGSQTVDAAVAGVPLVWVARIGTIYYYLFFWVLMPIVGLIETPKKLPASIAQSVLGEHAAAPAE